MLIHNLDPVIAALADFQQNKRVGDHLGGNHAGGGFNPDQADIGSLLGNSCRIPGQA